MAQVKGNIFTFAGVTDVTDCVTSREVMEKAKLNWTVAKAKVMAQMPGLVDYEGKGINKGEQFLHGSNSYKEINNTFCTYRTDINYPLGMVKERYTPVQNIDAFKFFDDAIGKNEAIWFTAGCSGYGNKVFVSAKLPEPLLINGKDPIDNYLVFSTSHDGSHGVRILYTPIRLICFNAMNSAIKNASSYISIRHTQSAHAKIANAASIIEASKVKIDWFKQAMESATKKKMDDEKVKKYFANIILSKDELHALAITGHHVSEVYNKSYSALEDSNISSKKVTVLNDMYNYYFTGPGQREYLGTAYGAYNAVNGYYSNIKNFDGIKRMEGLLYGTEANKIEEAGNLIFN